MLNEVNEMAWETPDSEECAWQCADELNAPPGNCGGIPLAFR